MKRIIDYFKALYFAIIFDDAQKQYLSAKFLYKLHNSKYATQYAKAAVKVIKLMDRTIIEDRHVRVDEEVCRDLAKHTSIYHINNSKKKNTTVLLELIKEREKNNQITYKNASVLIKDNVITAVLFGE